MRLLDAAEDLIAAKGFDDAPISEIAQRAGSSVGAFYRRFHDKNGLLHSLQERFSYEARATADDALDPARWEGASVAEVLSSVVAFLVDVGRERGGLIRAFILRAVVDPAIRERAEKLNTYVQDRLVALLLPRAAEITHPEPERALRFGYRVVGAVLDQRVLRGAIAGGGFPESDGDLAAELTHLFLGYLGVRPVPSVRT